MAAATTRKAPCCICEKENARVRCEGCSRLFCLLHLTSHQEELSKQLDEIEVSRDLFRQELTDKTAQPHEDALMAKIDQWEGESMHKVQQVAESARQMLSKCVAEHYSGLEEKLAKLTDEIRRSRKENDYFEADLDQWKTRLEKLRVELAQPSSVKIERTLEPLITKVHVRRVGQKESTNHNSARFETKKINRVNMPSIVFKCPFCDHRCFKTDFELHKVETTCPQNPENVLVRQCRASREQSNSHLGRSAQRDEPDHHGTLISCEYCGRRIPKHVYEEHSNDCRA